MATDGHSAVYEGWVRHRRFAPVPHAFRYRLFMMYLDLDELPRLFEGIPGWSVERPNLASFRRRDYLGPADRPLDACVRDLVEERTGHRPAGPVRLLTHMRYLGYCFNPVSFYYCFAADGVGVESVVAEITNTPWGERHAYVLSRAPGGGLRARFAKEFHVSPFMPMTQEYDWRFGDPGRRLALHMANRQEGEVRFDATLALRRHPLEARVLARVLLAHPLMTARVSAGIYWQALRLWIKRAPFHSHPGAVTRSAAKQVVV